MKQDVTKPRAGELPSIPALLQAARWYIYEAPVSDKEFLKYQPYAKEAIDTAIRILTLNPGDGCSKTLIKQSVMVFNRQNPPSKM